MSGRWFLALATVTAIGCASQQTMPTRSARYDAELELVFRSTLEATVSKYPNLNSSLATRTIQTKWHDVSMRPGLERGLDSAVRLFVRFDIRVVGDRPWQVEIVGHASEWRNGDALPDELVGSETPSWLDSRTNGLSSAIHARLKQFAIVQSR